MESKEDLKRKLREKTRGMQKDRRSLHGKSYDELKKEKWEEQQKKESESEENKNDI